MIITMYIQLHTGWKLSVYVLCLHDPACVYISTDSTAHQGELGCAPSPWALDLLLAHAPGELRFRAIDDSLNIGEDRSWTPAAKRSGEL